MTTASWCDASNMNSTPFFFLNSSLYVLEGHALWWTVLHSLKWRTACEDPVSRAAVKQGFPYVMLPIAGPFSYLQMQMRMGIKITFCATIFQKFRG